MARTDLQPGILMLSNVQSGRFAVNCQLPSLAGPIPVHRGWVSEDAWIRGRQFRFISTHLYPVPEMRCKTAIRRGLAWGLGNMEKPGFQIRNCWIDGDRAVVEVDTHHIFKGGMGFKFPQVFVIESCGGCVTRLQAYEPYPPPGIPGLFSKVTRWMWKLTGK